MKKNIESTKEELVQPIVDARNIEIVDIEYVKEAGQFYLRIYLVHQDLIDHLKRKKIS